MIEINQKTVQFVIKKFEVPRLRCKCNFNSTWPWSDAQDYDCHQKKKCPKIFNRIDKKYFSINKGFNISHLAVIFNLHLLAFLGFLWAGLKRGFIRTCLVTNKFIISKCFVFGFSLQNWPNLRGARFSLIDEWARIVLFGFWTNSTKLIQSQIYLSDKMAINKIP